MRVATILLAATTLAAANGRPPLTNAIYFGPNDNHSIYVRTTFGLLISHDDCTFRWVCEQNIGYGGSFDPKYAIAADGAIFATTYTGLRVSRDQGCTFTTAIPDLWIDSIDIAKNGDIWVATADSGHPNNVFRSTDNGMTFQPRGMLSPTIWWKSVLVAPSDPHTIYVTGYQVAGAMDGGQMPPTAHLMQTTDDGEHWTPSPLQGVTFGQQAISYVMAVAPNDARTIMYVTEYGNPPNGDRLYRSVDGGQTLVEVLATTSKIRQVFYRDANTVFVASGPGDSYVSTDGGQTFQTLGTWVDPTNNAPQLGCINQRGNELYACGANWNPDFKAVGKSDDGIHWNKLTRFVELAGPVECPAGTPNKDVCDPLWYGSGGLKEQFGTSGPACTGAPVVDAAPKTTGGCCDAGSSPASPLLLGALYAFTRRRSTRRTR